MILPTKHLPTERSLLGVGAEILVLLDQPKTVSRLWTDIQAYRGESGRQVTFDWFVLSLGMLYTIEAIDMNRGRLLKLSIQ